MMRSRNVKYLLLSISTSFLFMVVVIAPLTSLRYELADIWGQARAVAPSAFTRSSPEHEVQAAWRRAQEAGAYHFSTEIVQTTYPAPALVNVGRSSRKNTIYLEGQTNLPERQLYLTLWTGGGNTFTRKDGVDVRIEGDHAYGRIIGGEWKEMDDFSNAFAPGNDLMAYLAGAKNVKREDAKREDVESPFTLHVSRFTFDVDGPAFARYLRDQLERQLREKGELPLGLTLDSSAVYRGATGQGEVWIDSRGLPLRLSVHLVYPPERNGERVEANIKTDFRFPISDFRFTTAQSPISNLQSLTSKLQSTIRNTQYAIRLGLLLTVLALTFLVIAYRKARPVYVAIVLVVILSMLVTPLLQSHQAAAFMKRQAARQAELEQRQEARQAAREAQEERTGSDWDLHHDPLQGSKGAEEQGSKGASPAPSVPPTFSELPQVPQSSPKFPGVPQGAFSSFGVQQATESLAPECTDEEKNTDSDDDGLTDCDEKAEYDTDPTRKDTDGDGLQDGWEVLRLGTDPTKATGFDSDGDGIGDYLEVVGFEYRGKRWYSNPNGPDTDQDGQPDSLECPERATRTDGTTPDRATPCRDTDDDGTPDLFDLDSDGDGVPDKIDLSPETVLGNTTPFTRTNPFNLMVNNLASKPGQPDQYYPVLVDFQLRPVNPEHLTYALNVLDWPSGDEDGQIMRRRGNDSTFADVMSEQNRKADPRLQNGDMRLIPMLEVQMSGGASLPLAFTNPRTSLQLQGEDYIDPQTGYQRWISATIGLEQDGADIRVTFDFQGKTPVDKVGIYAGTCATTGDLVHKFENVSGDTHTIPNTKLVDLANGEHFITPEKVDHLAACAPLGDIPNAGTDDMIDPEPLRPYGVSVRDKDKAGNVLLYAPLNMVPDESGGGRVAFSARVPYQPNGNSLGDAQQVRVVWLVQMLTDHCKVIAENFPSPPPAWCYYETSWDLNQSQIVHTYAEDWLLTGLAVREDHGLDMAIAWEDPAADDDRDDDGWLWLLANQLQEAYISGRDQDGNNIRDLGINTQKDGLTVADTTLASRFDRDAMTPGTTITDRLGIPLTVTLQVKNLPSYPTQDYVAQVMMSETVKVLSDNFDAYPDTTPTLLFAREERARSTNLDMGDSRTIAGTTVNLDFTGRPVETIAAMNWAPYRYRDGAWGSYPMEEYWDLLETRLRAAFPEDPDLPDDVNREIVAGQVLIGKTYYLTMHQGRTGLVQRGDYPLSYQYDPRQSDDSLAMTVSTSMEKSGVSVGKGIKAVLTMVVENIVAEHASIKWMEDMVAHAVLSLRKPLTPSQMFFKAIGRGILETGKDVVGSVKTGLSTLVNKLYGEAGSRSAVRGVMVSAAIVLAAAAVVTAIVIAFVNVDTGLMVDACMTSVTSAITVVTSIKTIADVVSAARSAEYLSASAYVSSQIKAISKAAVICAVIGLVIGVVVAFAGFIVSIAMAHLKVGSMAANALFAEAVASTITAVIMFVIALIPVVGQIIAAVIAIIDALIAAACAIASAIKGENVRETTWGEALCRGITGSISYLINWLIYGATIMVDMERSDRLVFGSFDHVFVNPELGASVGNQIKYTVSLTNTINIVKIPVDWKAASYAWRYTRDGDKNLKSSTFKYEWQTEEKDLHVDEDGNDLIDLNQQSPPWQSDTGTRPFYIGPTATSSGFSLDEAGINRHPSLYLAEGYAVPAQECFVVPNPAGCVAAPWAAYVCWVPVCHIRAERGTSHIDLGQTFTFDVFPATLDEFYQPFGKDGGYSLAWGQTSPPTLGGTEGGLTFARQKDFDGDGLLNHVDRGSDPDDSRWDADGDGLSDYFEFQNGSDPTLYDTDGDGLSDADEFRLGTDPNRMDSDGDGLTDREETDGWEFVYAFAPNGTQLRTWVLSDPLEPDTDNDGLSDFKEKVYGFNPRVWQDPTVLSLQAGAWEAGAPRLLLRFEEAAGSETFTDYSGYRNNAACSVDACPDAGRDGKYGAAVQFHGNEFLSIPHSQINALRNNFTVAAWIYPTELSGVQRIVATARTESNNGFGFGTSGTDLRFSTFGVKNYTLTGVGLQTNRWQHVAAVMDGNNAVTFYVDGVKKGTIAHSAPAQADPDDTLLIGATTANGSADSIQRFNGLIDEVTVFDRALSQSEIRNMLLKARYNPNDSFVQVGDTLSYTATVSNKLYDRYAQGLYSLATTDPSALSQVNVPPRTFVLQPLEQTMISGTVQAADVAASRAVSLTQVASALITNWREQSNYAALWLKLDEPSGVITFTDSSGTMPPANGTCTGATCPQAGESGYFDYAVKFDGSQYIRLADTKRLGLQNSSFSVSAWIKGSDFSNTSTVLGTENSGFDYLFMGINFDGKPYMKTTHTLESNDRLQTDAWYHIVYRYDKDTDKQAIFVNGELKASGDGGGAFSPKVAAYLGKTPAHTDGSYFKGWIDDVRIFRRALTEKEIRDLFEKPVLRLQFEEQKHNPYGGGTYYADASGMGNDAECGTHCPDATDGVFGQGAASFSGDDYLYVDSSPSLDLSDGQFAIAAWLYPLNQGEPVDPDCNFHQKIWRNFSWSGSPVSDSCVNWPQDSMDAVDSPSGTWLVNIENDRYGTWSPCISRRYTGNFRFQSGTYTFFYRFGGGARVYVDGSLILLKPYVGADELYEGSVRFHVSSGVHEIKVEYQDCQGDEVIQFGWTPPHVQGILGKDVGKKNAYPTLQTVGRKVRFGFGTGSDWYAVTTDDPVLTANAWNHVVLSFGPTYKVDGSFDQNVATLYVNNQRVGDWGVGNRKPSSSAKSLYIGRSSYKGKVYVDRFKVIKKADQSPHCEVYLTWGGHADDKICTTTGTAQNDDCTWDGLKEGDTVEVNVSKTVSGQDILEAWEDDHGAEKGHNYGDDLLCDVGSSACTRGQQFGYDTPSMPVQVFDWQGDNKSPSDGLAGEDQTRINLYLGDSSHWAYRNPSIPFRGKMDELVIYKRPLSADQVQELYLSSATAMHLPLDDPPGSQSFENAVDVSRQGNAFCSASPLAGGTEGGCPTAGVSGRINQAALFDGDNDVLNTTLTIDQSSDDIDGVTMMAWVYPKSTSSGYHMVVSTDNNGWDWTLARYGGNWAVFNGTNKGNTGISVDVNQWQHIAAVFIPGQGTRFYKNGVRLRTDSTIGYDSSTGLVAIGNKSSGGNYYFDGVIDDVRIFNRPLSDDDIMTVYKLAPVFQMHLDEHQGATTFTDAAGNNNGTCRLGTPCADVTFQNLTCTAQDDTDGDGGGSEFYIIMNHDGTQERVWEGEDITVRADPYPINETRSFCGSAGISVYEDDGGTNDDPMGGTTINAANPGPGSQKFWTWSPNYSELFLNWDVGPAFLPLHHLPEGQHPGPGKPGNGV